MNSLNQASSTPSEVSFIRGGPFYRAQWALKLIGPHQWDLARAACDRHFLAAFAHQPNLAAHTNRRGHFPVRKLGRRRCWRTNHTCPFAESVRHRRRRCGRRFRAFGLSSGRIPRLQSQPQMRFARRLPLPQRESPAKRKCPVRLRREHARTSMGATINLK
jgi:hypothetical protein